MTSSAKYVVFICLLAFACLPAACSKTTETSSSVAQAVSGESIASPDSPVVAEPHTPSNVVATHGKNESVETKTSRNVKISPREQLKELAWLLASSDPDSQQHADEIVRELSESGYASMLAVRDYLSRDLGFGSGETPGKDEQNLRQVLLDLLLQFDFPEVESYALELLDSHPTPSEIWQLGRYLEEKHPGIYTDTVRLVAEEAFVHSDPAVAIPGGFFQLLGETGDDETAFLLSDVPIHQEAYANFALAAIPDGSGIPVLEQEALLLGNGQPSTRSRLIIELLACQAYRNTAAADVLIEMAQRGLIPADTWPHVMAIVSGSLVLTLEPPPQGQLETHTIFRSEGNQVIYRVVRPLVDEPPDIADQRHQLLDSLQALAPGYRGASK